MDQLKLNIPSTEFIENFFKKVFEKLEKIQTQQQKSQSKDLKFYRNKDLKKIFGLSDNTISEYRMRGILTYTKLGEIYYYPSEELIKSLNNNSNSGRIV